MLPNALKATPSPVFTKIISTGSYLPEKILTNDDLSKFVDTSDEWIRSRSGIQSRHIAADGEETSDLAVMAAKRALEGAGLAATDIDLIVVATTTPDVVFPSTACIVQDKLGAKNAAAFDIQAACTGFVYGLTTAAQFIMTGKYKNVLVVGSEVLSKVTDWQDRNTCILFGDGAGAVVVSQVQKGGITTSFLGADGSGANLLELPAGGTKEPADYDTVKNRRHYIKMNGNEVFKFAVKVFESSTRRVVEKANLTLDDIDLIIPHQANIRIIDAAVRRLKFPIERVMVNLDKYGNMSSASIPVAMHEAVRMGKIKKGDKIILVAFGAGLTWGAVLIEWNL